MKMCSTTPITFSSLPTMDRVSLSVAARLRRSTNILVTAAQHSWGRRGGGRQQLGRGGWFALESQQLGTKDTRHGGTERAGKVQWRPALPSDTPAP